MVLAVITVCLCAAHASTSGVFMLTRERARQQVRQAAPPLSAEEKGEILSLINTDYQGTLQLFEGLLPEEVAETVRAFLIRQRAGGTGGLSMVT